MKRFLLFLSLLVLFVFPADSQQAKAIVTVTPELAKVSTERLKKLDVALEEWVKKGWMHGGTVMIIRDGKTVYHKAVGYYNLEARTPLQKDAIFRIASQTKAVTSVAIMMLFEEGKLLINDPVSKYIPSFKKQSVLEKFNAADTTYTTVPANREITIKDLLTHTSGIGYAQIGSREANSIYAKSNITVGIGVQDETLLGAMTRLGTLPLMHQPGQKWTYGLNTDLLGCLVEVISGVSLDEFFRTKIFEPLGMKDTYFLVPASKANRMIGVYSEDGNGQLVPATKRMLNSPVDASYPFVKSTYYSGGAGLSSTILDYGIFLQTLLNGGEYNGKRILSRNTVRMMTMNQIGDLNMWNEDKFGLGFNIVSEKNGNIPAQAGTYSWGGAFSTSYWVDPKEKLVLQFYRQLTNTTHWDLTEKFRALAYQAIND
ncbi:MAG: serine hydrolase [Chitinophagaceae bacterium]|nr:serine hydrolase [Chitinophagaceae bacterium]